MELFTEPDNLFIDLNQIVIGRNRRIFISYKECIVSERLDFQIIIKFTSLEISSSGRPFKIARYNSPASQADPIRSPSGT